MMNAHYRLKSYTKFLVLIALLAAGCASNRSAFKKGHDAEAARNFEEAMQQYKIALDRSPGNIEYRLKYNQTRYSAAYEHFQRGRRALDANNFEVARMEFARTLELDPSHSLAEQELAKVNAVLAARNNKEPEPGHDFE